MVNKQTKSGFTALMWACHKGYVDIVTLLLAGGADMSITSQKGCTALSLAKERGDVELINMLEVAAAAEISGPLRKQG